MVLDLAQDLAVRDMAVQDMVDQDMAVQDLVDQDLAVQDLVDKMTSTRALAALVFLSSFRKIMLMGHPRVKIGTWDYTSFVSFQV